MIEPTQSVQQEEQADKKSGWLWLIIILFFLLIIVLLASMVFYPFLKKPEIPMISTKEINKTIIGTEQINLFLYVIKAYELHKPPFSSNIPKIEFVIDNKLYNSEIVNGKIITREGGIENLDLRVIMSREEFIAALNSDTKAYLQKSVEQGEVKIEILAGNTELLAKGYLSLYKELTGKSLTGSIIRLFR